LTATFTREAVRDLYDEYAYLLDERDYETWLELFVPDCDYRIISRENWERGLPLATVRCDSRGMLADRIEAVESTQFYAARTMRHFVTSVRPSAAGGPPLAVTANFLVTEVVGEEPARVHSVGQYRDAIVEREGHLRFATKIAIYDAPLVLTSLVHAL